MTAKKTAYDEIGYWSEIKLDIIREYASAYSKILTAQTKPSLRHSYIDAFAGAGLHRSKLSGEFVPGSPLNALLVKPQFRDYYFVDLDSNKIQALEDLAAPRKDVHILQGDCNQVLVDKVFPEVRYPDYRRALCVLDPYGLHLNWEVMATAGAMKSIEIFLNFPVADINRNVLWRNRTDVSPDQIARMNAFWGDESWVQAAYVPSRQSALFGPPSEDKTPNEAVAEAFRQRLIEVAGFKHVPVPIAMRNRQNAIVYYLFFASQRPAAESIVRDIFTKYRDRKGA